MSNNEQTKYSNLWDADKGWSRQTHPALNYIHWKNRKTNKKWSSKKTVTVMEPMASMNRK